LKVNRRDFLKYFGATVAAMSIPAISIPTFDKQKETTKSWHEIKGWNIGGICPRTGMICHFIVGYPVLYRANILMYDGHFMMYSVDAGLNWVGVWEIDMKEVDIVIRVKNDTI
jgi:hypothetical protein